MNDMIQRIITALIFLVYLIGPGLARAELTASYGRYHALVIGNAEYRHMPDMETSIRDAGIVADMLRRNYGFRVELLLNASRYTIMTSLNRIRRDLTVEDNLLIYYIGHGVVDQSNDHGFWLPIDAEPDNQANWIDNERIIAFLKALTARHAMVVTNFFHQDTRSQIVETKPAGIPASEGAQDQTTMTRSRTVLASRNSKTGTKGDDNGHSIFARNFVEALDENSEVLLGQSLFESMKERIAAAGDPEPHYFALAASNDQGGEFPFVSVPAHRGVQAVHRDQTASIEPSQEVMEQAFWDLIKDESDFEFFEGFLERFPGGQYAAEAEKQLKSRLAAHTDQTTDAEIAEPTQAAEPPIYIVVRQSNVRAGPSTAHERVTTLRAGTEVKVLGQSERQDWYRIELSDGREVFIHNSLLKPKI
jgi:uncharacterized caspase-like protein